MSADDHNGRRPLLYLFIKYGTPALRQLTRLPILCRTKTRDDPQLDLKHRIITGPARMHPKKSCNEFNHPTQTDRFRTAMSETEIIYLEETEQDESIKARLFIKLNRGTGGRKGVHVWGTGMHDQLCVREARKGRCRVQEKNLFFTRLKRSRLLNRIFWLVGFEPSGSKYVLRCYQFRGLLRDKYNLKRLDIQVPSCISYKSILLTEDIPYSISFNFPLSEEFCNGNCMNITLKGPEEFYNRLHACGLGYPFCNAEYNFCNCI